jgi:hypothetical protein
MNIMNQYCQHNKSSWQKRPHLLWLLALLSTAPVWGADKKAVIYDESTKTLYFDGLLNSVNSLKAQEVLQNNPVQWLSIKSKGGEVKPAISLARQIFKKRINVRVDDYCISSCANYIFTAGNLKLLRQDAVLGLHGGPGHIDDIDLSQIREAVKSLPKAEQEARLNAAKDELEKYRLEALDLQVQFYKEVGINQQYPDFGRASTQKLDNEQWWGWYYSPQMMQSMGINNVFIISNDWQPKEILGKARFSLVDVKG